MLGNCKNKQTFHSLDDDDQRMNHFASLKCRHTFWAFAGPRLSTSADTSFRARHVQSLLRQVPHSRFLFSSGKPNQQRFRFEPCDWPVDRLVVLVSAERSRMARSSAVDAMLARNEGQGRRIQKGRSRGFETFHPIYVRCHTCCDVVYDI